MRAIEVDGLSVSYGTLRAVNEVSFAVESGEVLALLGPNGAGKTATVESLQGYPRTATRTCRGEAEGIAARMVLAERGAVVGSGPPAELMRSSGSDEIRFAAPSLLDTAGLGRALNAFVDEVAPGEYRVGLPPTPANVAALTA